MKRLHGFLDLSSWTPLDQIHPSALDLGVPLDRRRGLVLDSLGVHARLLSLLELKPGARVLELGCKTGYMAALISALVGPEGSVQHGDPLSPSTWEPDVGAVSRVHVAEVLDSLPDDWAQVLPVGTLIVGKLAVSGRIHFVRARVVGPPGLSIELLEEVHQAVAQDGANEVAAGELEPFVRSACDRPERTEQRRLRLLGSGEPCQS